MFQFNREREGETREAKKGGRLYYLKARAEREKERTMELSGNSGGDGRRYFFGETTRSLTNQTRIRGKCSLNAV